MLALEPESGKEVWRYEMKGRLASQRGVAYWAGDKDAPPYLKLEADRAECEVWTTGAGIR